MNLKSIPRIIKNLKKYYYSLRNEPEAIEQFRLLILGFITCVVILYGGHNLFVAPKQETLQQKNLQKQTLQTSIPAQQVSALEPMIKQLLGKRQSLKEEIDRLNLQKELLLQQWKLLGDSNRFANIIFTLQPAAPVHIENDLEQMTVAETRSVDMYDLHPVTLNGTSSFKDLFNYLSYIEKHGEVSLIDNLEIEIVPGKEDIENAEVHFSLMVGRMDLKQTI